MSEPAGLSEHAKTIQESRRYFGRFFFMLLIVVFAVISIPTIIYGQVAPEILSPAFIVVVVLCSCVPFLVLILTLPRHIENFSLRLRAAILAEYGPNLVRDMGEIAKDRKED